MKDCRACGHVHDTAVCPNICQWCGQTALGFAMIPGIGRVCHHDTRSCYNDATYRNKERPPAVVAGTHDNSDTNEGK
jgi:hypothetical protein